MYKAHVAVPGICICETYGTNNNCNLPLVASNLLFVS